MNIMQEDNKNFQKKLEEKFNKNQVPQKSQNYTQKPWNNQSKVVKKPKQSFKPNNSRYEDNKKQCDFCHYTNHATENCFLKNKKIICQICEKQGHSAKDCWSRNPHSKNY